MHACQALVSSFFPCASKILTQSNAAKPPQRSASPYGGALDDAEPPTVFHLWGVPGILGGVRDEGLATGGVVYLPRSLDELGGLASAFGFFLVLFLFFMFPPLILFFPFCLRVFYWLL